jgi:hypothetical protein
MAVADPKDGYTDLVDLIRDRWGSFFIHRLWAAGKYEGCRSHGLDLVNRHVVPNDLGIDVALPDSAGDELRVLGPEIYDKDGAFMGTHLTLRITDRAWDPSASPR